MSDDTTRRRNTGTMKLSSGWIQALVGIAVLIVTAALAYGSFQADHNASVQRIERLERQDEKQADKLDALTKDTGEILGEQRAQRADLAEIKQAIRDLAKAK